MSGKLDITGETIREKKVAIFYVTTNARVVREDREYVVILEAFYEGQPDDEDEPIELRINLGDDLDDIENLLNSIYYQAYNISSEVGRE